jgi:hypothetical protein
MGGKEKANTAKVKKQTNRYSSFYYMQILVCKYIQLIVYASLQGKMGKKNTYVYDTVANLTYCLHAAAKSCTS